MKDVHMPEPGEVVEAIDRVEKTKAAIERMIPRVQQHGERVDTKTLEEWRWNLASACVTLGAVRDLAREGAEMREEEKQISDLTGKSPTGQDGRSIGDETQAP